jgi:hypothetical protein
MEFQAREPDPLWDRNDAMKSIRDWNDPPLASQEISPLRGLLSLLS